jgi:N-ethylmaleimide reductase
MTRNRAGAGNVPTGQLPVAPSAIAARGSSMTPDGPQPFVVPRALSLDDIGIIVQQFADAARRAALAPRHLQ